MTSTQTVIVRDRNRIAFYIALGFTCDFVPRPDGRLDGEFQICEELEKAAQAFNQNYPVPVQSFTSACRFISDAIQNHRQRLAVKGGAAHE